MAAYRYTNHIPIEPGFPLPHSQPLSSSIRSLIKGHVALIRDVKQNNIRQRAGTIVRLNDGAIGHTAMTPHANGIQLSTNPDDCASIQMTHRLPRHHEVSIALATVVGSRCQGLETIKSDTDWRGVYVSGAAVQCSIDGSPEQLVQDDHQLCFWEIGKFFRLALQANPTVLESFYSPLRAFEASWIADEFASLRNDNAFLSQRAYATYFGYAESQLEKMRRADRSGSRTKWPHAMHLIRLLRQGIALFHDRVLELEVRPEHRDELLAIKRGEFSWKDFTTVHAQLQRDFERAYQASTLPEHPDVERVGALYSELKRRVLLEGSS